jgi:hypothetical protein
MKRKYKKKRKTTTKNSFNNSNPAMQITLSVSVLRLFQGLLKTGSKITENNTKAKYENTYGNIILMITLTRDNPRNFHLL